MARPVQAERSLRALSRLLLGPATPSLPSPSRCGISEEDQRGPLERWGRGREALHRDLRAALSLVWVGRPGSLPRAAPPAPQRTPPRPDAGSPETSPCSHSPRWRVSPPPAPSLPAEGRTHLMSWSALALPGPRQKPLHPTQQLFGAPLPGPREAPPPPRLPVSCGCGRPGPHPLLELGLWTARRWPGDHSRVLGAGQHGSGAGSPGVWQAPSAALTEK